MVRGGGFPPAGSPALEKPPPLADNYVRSVWNEGKCEDKLIRGRRQCPTAVICAAGRQRLPKGGGHSAYDITMKIIFTNAKKLYSLGEVQVEVRNPARKSDRIYGKLRGNTTDFGKIDPRKTTAV